MMAGDGKAATRAVRVGAMNDIRQGPIRLDKIKVRGRKVIQRMPEVAHQRHALEKNFRHSHG